MCSSKNPLSIAICEDSKEEELRLLGILEQSNFATVCSVFQTGEALLEVYQPQKFDLVLMDIYMSGISGVETVARIRRVDPDVPVAFVTTSTEHALEGYRLSVLKYIEKPCQPKDIEEILKLAKLEKDSVPCLTVHKNRREEHIPLSSIQYLEQQFHQLDICCLGGRTLQISEKLSALLPQLQDPRFFVPHKSYCVNLACVQYIDKELKCFKMAGGQNVPIRRESMGKAKAVLEEFLFDRERWTR